MFDQLNNSVDWSLPLETYDGHEVMIHSINKDEANPVSGAYLNDGVWVPCQWNMHGIASDSLRWNTLSLTNKETFIELPDMGFWK